MARSEIYNYKFTSLVIYEFFCDNLMQTWNEKLNIVNT